MTPVEFRLGVNLPWIDGQYGHDLGNNYLMRVPAYWSAGAQDSAMKRARFRACLRQLREAFGFSLVRLWVLEGGEGVESLSAEDRIDQTLLQNLRLVLDLAHQEGIALYLCLVSSHPRHTSKAFERDKRWIREAAAGRGGAPSFLTSVLTPLLRAVGDHPALWAIDVINEPEKYIVATPDSPANPVSWGEVQAMLVACADVIRDETQGRVLVSCGSDGGAWLRRPFRNALLPFTGLGLDFLDMHLYDDRGDIPMHYRTRGMHEPCWIGEFGARSPVYDDTLQSVSAEAFLAQAVRKGYAGAMLWYYALPLIDDLDARTQTDPYSIVTSRGVPRPVVQVVRRFLGQPLIELGLLQPADAHVDDGSPV